MAERRIITVQIDAETGKAISSMEELQQVSSKTTTKVSGEMSGMVGKIDALFGGAISKISGAIKGVKGFVLGMKSLKAALISTGIGALVVALGSLVAYFTSTKRGAEKLQQITAGLSAAFSVITDRLSAFGETLIWAFESPGQAIEDFGNLIWDFVIRRFDEVMRGIEGLGTAIALLFEGEFSAAAEAAGNAVLDLVTGLNPLAGAIRDNIDSIGEMADEIAREANEAARLQRQLQAVADAERSLGVERSKANLEIAKARLIADDLTKSTKERIAAVEAAGEMEIKLAERELAVQRQKYNAIAAQNALGESTADDLDKEYQALAQIYDLEKTSIETRKRLQTELNSLRAEAAAEELAKVKEFRDAEAAYAAEQKQRRAAEAAAIAKDQESADSQLTQMEQRNLSEIERAKLKYDKLLELAHGNSDLELRIREQQALEEEAINARTLANKRAQNIAYADSAIALAGSAIAAAIALNDAGEQKTEAQRRKAFERDKKLKIAAATIQMIQGASGAFQQGMSTYPAPYGAIVGALMAAISVASGIAQINKIKQTTYGGGVVRPATSGGSVPSVGQNSTPRAPNISGNIGQGQTQSTIRAYVVSKEGTNQAQREQLIEDQAALV